MTHLKSPTINAVLSLASVPWAGFVTVFMFYALVSLTLVAGVRWSTPIVAAAYLLPAVAYSALVISRAARVVANLRIDFSGLWHQPAR